MAARDNIYAKVLQFVSENELAKDPLALLFITTALGLHQLCSNNAATLLELGSQARVLSPPTRAKLGTLVTLAS